MLKVIEYNGNLEAVALKLDNRKENISKEVNDAVMKIIDDINKRGNEALYEYCLKFDGYQIKDEADLIVSEAEKEIALKQVDANYLRILERTKEQIIEFHKNQFTLLQRLEEPEKSGQKSAQECDRISLDYND